MKRALLGLWLGLVLVLGGLSSSPAMASGEVDNYWNCSTTNASGQTQLGWCPVSAAYPFPAAGAFGTYCATDESGVKKFFTAFPIPSISPK